MNCSTEHQQPLTQGDSLTDIQAYLAELFSSGECFEIRIPVNNGAMRARFNDPATAARMIVQETQLSQPEGVWVTLQPIDPSLYREAPDWFSRGTAAKKGDILGFRNFCIDVDPIKSDPGGNSTDEEKDACVAKAEQIGEFMAGFGAPKPMRCMSGNGAHLIYRVKLSLEDEQLLRAVLAGLANRFNSAASKIDLGMSQPAHLGKVMGTMTRKGPNTPERPQRRATWLNSEMKRELLSREVLEKIVEELGVPVAPPKPRQPAVKPNGDIPLLQFKPILETPCLRYCRDEAQDLDYEWWLCMISVLAQCEGGRELIHDLSSSYYKSPTRKYTRQETDKKIDDVISSGLQPYNCDTIRTKLNFDGCDGCPYHGQVRSPADVGKMLPKAVYLPQPEEVLVHPRQLLSPTFNDMGNAERFARIFGKLVIYCASQKQWYIWDGKRWKADSTNQVLGLAKQAIKIFEQLIWELPADTKEQEDRRDQLLKHANKSGNAHLLESMLKLASVELAVTPDQLDADRWLLNCESGTIQLKTGQLKPHDPADLITKISPVKYDPSVVEAPDFEGFLKEIMLERKDLMDWVLRFLGYCLTGDMREEIFPIFNGDGDNGKSVLLRVMQALLADYASTAAPEALLKKRTGTISNDIADLQGARFVAALETDDGQKLDVPVIKRITGRDAITARRLNVNNTTFAPQCKLVIATNKLPDVPADDKGLWRRLAIVPFDFKVKEEDKNQNLAAELSEPESLKRILGVLVHYCLKWQKQGLRPLPEAMKAATGDYRENSDWFDDWTRSCCDTSDPEAKTLPNVVQESAKLYAMSIGVTSPRPQQVTRWLKSRGIEKQGSGGIKTYRGIRLKPDCLSMPSVSEAPPAPVSAVQAEEKHAA